MSRVVVSGNAATSAHSLSEGTLRAPALAAAFLRPWRPDQVLRPAVFLNNFGFRLVRNAQEIRGLGAEADQFVAWRLLLLHPGNGPVPAHAGLGSVALLLVGHGQEEGVIAHLPARQQL